MEKNYVTPYDMEGKLPLKQAIPLGLLELSSVNTDQTEHTARRFSAWLPPIQCTLSGHQCMLIIQV